MKVDSKALQAKLQSMEKKEANKAVRKGTRAGAKVVQDKAKSLVPVKSGELKRNIKVRAKKGKGIGARCTLSFKGDNEFYGNFQEWGWVTVNGRRIQGKHFMQKAADEAGSEAIDKAIKEIKNWIS